MLAGDYHTTPFPGELDAVNFFGMLHQESADDMRKLARKAFAALKPGGIVHVMDMMTDGTHTAPQFSALFAVTMALTTENGWVFSSDELKGWLEEAGFVDFEVSPLPPPMPHWLAKARKPSRRPYPSHMWRKDVARRVSNAAFQIHISVITLVGVYLSVTRLFVVENWSVLKNTTTFWPVFGLRTSHLS